MGQHIYERNGIKFKIDIEPDPKDDSNVMKDDSNGFAVTINNPDHTSEIEKALKSDKESVRKTFQKMYTVDIKAPENKTEADLLAFVQKQIDNALDREAAIRVMIAKKGEDVVAQLDVRLTQDRATNEKIEREAKELGLTLSGHSLRSRILEQIPEEFIQKRMNELKAKGADVDRGRMEFTFAAKTKDGAMVNFNLGYNLNGTGTNMATLSEEQKVGIASVKATLEQALTERTKQMYAAELKEGRQIREKFLDGVQTDILGSALNRMKDFLPGIEAIGGENAAKEAFSNTPPTAGNGPTMVAPQLKL